jgi:putative nucleotidyltransferase with HDIG domain
VLARTLDAAGRFTRRDAFRLVLFACGLVVLLTAILGADLVSPSLTPGVDLVAGQVAPASVRAPRAATYVSETQTEEKRAEAARAVDPKYDYTEAEATQISVAQVAAFRRLTQKINDAFGYDDPAARRSAIETAFPDLSSDSRFALLTLDAIRWGTIRDEAAAVLGARERTEIRDTEVVEERTSLPMRFPIAWTQAEKQLAAELVAPFIVPTSSYSESLTEAARTDARQTVAPVEVSYARGQLVVEAGATVTPLVLEAVRALGLDSRGIDLFRVAGWFVLSALIVLVLLAWIWRFRRELWHRDNALLLISLVIIVAVLAIKLSAGRSILPYFIPLAAVGIVITILLGAGPAMAVQAVVAIVAGAANGSSLELTTYFLLGGIAGIIAIHRGDRLQVFVQAGLAIAVVNAGVIAVFSLLGERDLTGTAQLFAAGLASAAGSAIAAAGVFAVLGDIFGIPTAFQLQELSSPTRPLLRRLLTEAPGTYHHSLMVGNLAERAAEAIGADPILARVAAYYHDVGKLANPVAFIENQAGGGNLHDDLDPETSARILRAHVADGIDLAYKAKLPKALIAFIPQHHGTARMSYFLEKARDEAASAYGGRGTAAGAAAAAAVPEAPFRHQGPKPQTREAAVLMLADSVEASVRSLATHDEPAIRAMVGRIVTERLEDGQFDECDLTLRDVERIREAFVGQLLGAYHQRIAYPQNKVVELEARRGAGTGA